MWLVIRRSDGAVVGTQRGDQKPEWDENSFEVKEWLGPEPALHDPDEGIESYDPTLDDPGYPAFRQSRIDFDALADKAATEVEWLNETIPLIPTMTGAEVRDVVHRIAKEQREELRAWRYVFRRLL